MPNSIRADVLATESPGSGHAQALIQRPQCSSSAHGLRAYPELDPDFTENLAPGIKHGESGPLRRVHQVLYVHFLQIHLFREELH